MHNSSYFSSLGKQTSILIFFTFYFKMFCNITSYYKKYHLFHMYLIYSSSDMFQKKNSLLTTASFSAYLFKPFSFLDSYTASLTNFEVARVGAVHISHSCITVSYYEDCKLL